MVRLKLSYQALLNLPILKPKKEAGSEGRNPTAEKINVKRSKIIMLIIKYIYANPVNFVHWEAPFTWDRVFKVLRPLPNRKHLIIA